MRVVDYSYLGETFKLDKLGSSLSTLVFLVSFNFFFFFEPIIGIATEVLPLPKEL